MRIAVLSGKGGTGKTFVSVNLAYALGKAVYADCDVEEPNGRLFLKPKVCRTEEVCTMIPVNNAEKCTGCRRCADFCKFNALAYIRNKLLVFPELCHACKGCILICPEKALKEGKKPVGKIEYGMKKDIEVITGMMNTGEATGVPVIRRLLAELPSDRDVIIDCPPGSACTVMESIKDADFCVLVAEPTRFGLHNLDMVYKLVKLFNKPHALIVNKDMGDKLIVEEYCAQNKIKVLVSIPYDTELALANSKGFIAAEKYPCFRELFNMILDSIEKEVHYEAAGNFKR
ncbi:4Fe-4S binding protein [Ruminiclostridium sufflavum]|nr:ATP-binding protein [Ruminiclostridium sufflavum]